MTNASNGTPNLLNSIKFNEKISTLTDLKHNNCFALSTAKSKLFIVEIKDAKLEIIWRTDCMEKIGRLVDSSQSISSTRLADQIFLVNHFYQGILHIVIWYVDKASFESFSVR